MAQYYSLFYFLTDYPKCLVMIKRSITYNLIYRAVGLELNCLCLFYNYKMSTSVIKCVKSRFKKYIEADSLMTIWICTFLISTKSIIYYFSEFKIMSKLIMIMFCRYLLCLCCQHSIDTNFFIFYFIL